MDGFSLHLRRQNRSSGRHPERDGKAIDVETFRWELVLPSLKMIFISRDSCLISDSKPKLGRGVLHILHTQQRKPLESPKKTLDN